MGVYKREEGMHFSQINQYQKCRKAHKYAYRQNLVPIVTKRALAIGTCAHASLEANIKGESSEEYVMNVFAEYASVKGVTDEDIAKYREIAELGLEIGNNAWDFLGNRFETVVHDGIPLIEQRMRTFLPDGTVYHGSQDWVARDRNTGLVWLFDHKTRQTFLPDWTEELDLQLSSYQKILHDNGVHTDGTIKFQMKNAPPSKPKLNKPKKDGTQAMSRAYIRTTWDIYKEALLEAGLDPADYQEEMEPKFADVEFFRLTRALRTPEEVERVWNEVVIPVSDEIVNRPTEIRVMSFMACNMCSYRELCLEELKGGDTDFIRANSFRDVNDPIPELPSVEDFDFEDDMPEF